jgi:pimeloyl-ACP methyl ester carboxylesterase
MPLPLPPPLQVRHYGSPDGPVVMVLHGGPGAPGYMAPVCRELARREPGWAVREPLQRRADGESPLSVARHVADLIAVTPSGRRPVLVGASWGAMLALSTAALHPDRIAGLVLVGCGTYTPAARAGYETRMAQRLGEAGRARKAGLARRLAACRDGGDADAIDALLGELGELSTRAQSVDTDPGFGTGPDDCPPADAAGHAETWSDVLRLQADGTEPARFARIRCPVAMLHGADDPHPGPAIRDSLTPIIPAPIRYVEFADCGHEPWRERAARQAFFDGLQRIAGEMIADA